MTVEIIDASFTYELRHQVLRPNQNLMACQYPSDFDSDSFHLGVYQNEKLICVGSFYKENHPDLLDEVQYRLRGMATEPSKQGQGAGSQLIQFAETHMQQKKEKANVWWCNARISAAGYYEKLGLEQFGKTFEIHPIGIHKVMIRKF